MVRKKTNSDSTNKLLESIRNLLILQLSVSNVPVASIVKAANIYINNYYTIISKTKPIKKSPKKTIKKNPNTIKPKK